MPSLDIPLLDADVLLNPGERQVQARVADVASAWRSDIGRWFEQESAPIVEIALQLGGAGLLGMSLPAPYGSSAGAVEYGLACLEVEAVDSGLRSLMSVQGSLAMHAIHEFGSEEQRERWLPGMARGDVLGGFALTEPLVGSNPAEARTVARRTGGGWVLDGEKKWITNGPLAKVIVVWANTDEGVRGFLVPTDAPGVELTSITGRLSLRASASGQLAMRGVEADQLPGARGLRAPLSCLNEARFGIIFGALGAARDSLMAAIDYTTGREQFGKPLAGFQLVQAELADCAAELAAAMALGVHLARAKEQGRISAAQISLGKRTSAATALRIARRCRALLGANGVLLEHSPIRHATNLESVVTYEGTHEIHTLVLGQELTGLAAYR